MSEKEKPEINEGNDRRYEMLCGVILAFLAAVLAITNVAAGRTDGNQMVAVNDEAEAYSWYNTKSIKQTLMQGQHDILEALLFAGSISETAIPAIESEVERYASEVERYEKEKIEILKGSSVVGQENWAQDVDGVMGVVVGAQEYKALANRLDEIGNFYDLATLFLEISIVLGAISLLMDSKKVRGIFFYGMIMMGTVGGVVSAAGVLQGMGV